MSWAKSELASICDVFADGDWIETKDQSENGIRLIQTGNVGFGKFKLRDSKARYISEETFKRLRCIEIKQGDILISRLPDPVGRACVIPELNVKSITAVDCTIIRTNKKIINTEYLNYFCQSYEYFEQVKKNITGATRQRISRNLLGKIEVPIPPLPIQQKIVKKLDTIFTELDKATAAAAANVKNAEALFQSYLTGFFDEIKKNCKIKLLSEICDVRDGTHDSPKYVMEGIPFITQKNIRKNGLNLKYTKYISIKDHLNFYKRSNVAFGDILISMIGANRGMSAIVNESTLFSIKNVCLVKKGDKIDQNYLLYFFKSRQAQNYIKLFSKGGAQEFIGLTALRKFPIPVPSREIQVKVIEKLNIISTLSETTKEGYNKKFYYLTKLKQSILKQAFNGELVKAA